MTTQWSFLQVPLALITGAAIASNPNIWGPRGDGSGAVAAPVGHVPSPPSKPVPPPVEADQAEWQGPESPELRALRGDNGETLAELGLDGVVNDPYFFRDPGATEDFGTATEDFLEGLNQPDIPIARHPSVKKYVNFFTESSKGRGMFSTWLRRSGKYRPIISQALSEQGLPRDLEALVFIESGFWPTAKSPAGAMGLWQFMPGTARAYGLTVNKSYDERRSLWRSSEAAARHLADLHTRFKSWDLALAAYNYGYGNVERKLSEYGAESFWDVVDVEGSLPRETRRYVPKVLAVAVVLNNLDQYGFAGVKLDAAIRAVTFEVPPGTTMKNLARAAGTSVANLRSYNPEVVGGFIPDRGAPVNVHIPRQNLARARVMLPRLLGGSVQEVQDEQGDFFDWGRDRVNKPMMARLDRTMGSQKFDEPTPAKAAAPSNGEGRHRTAVVPAPERRLAAREATQAEAHSLLPSPAPQVSGSQLPVLVASAVGQDCQPASADGSEAPSGTSFDSSDQLMSSVDGPSMSLPEGDELAGAGLLASSQETGGFCDGSSTPGVTVLPAELTNPKYIDYVLRPGDSLAKLSQRFGVSVIEMVIDNRIRNPSHILEGRTLQIRDTRQSPQRSVLSYKVRRGESLAHIANRLNADVVSIARKNGIQNPNLIQVGQVILIHAG